MRPDKFTTRLNEALQEAQSLALARDNPYVEPAHVLTAMLDQDEGPRALLERAGANIAALRQAADGVMKGLPQVEGGSQLQVSRDLVALLQAAEKEAGKRGDQFIASEMFLLALDWKPASVATSSSPARCSCWRWPTPRPTSAASCAATA